MNIFDPIKNFAAAVIDGFSSIGEAWASFNIYPSEIKLPPAKSFAEVFKEDMEKIWGDLNAVPADFEAAKERFLKEHPEHRHLFEERDSK